MTSLPPNFSNLTNSLLLEGEILPQAQLLLMNFAQQETFHQQIEVAFGTNYDQEIPNTLRQQWLNEDFSSSPEIEIRTQTELNGAWGGYAQESNIIYLAEELIGAIALDTPELVIDNSDVVSVFLEEIGHYVDAQINRVDTDGDEGYIFSALVQGNELTTQELEILSQEDDMAIINIDGQNILIERAGTYTGDNIYEIINGIDIFLSQLENTIYQINQTSLPLVGDNLISSDLTSWISQARTALGNIQTTYTQILHLPKN